MASYDSMKNIDVMALQQREQSRGTKTPALDYKKVTMKGAAARFLFECSIKLNMKPLTSAMAATVFHRFFRECDPSNYDEYLIASSALYLAGKMKDDPVKIRDVINVAHNTLNRNASPLDLGDEYWAMRDAIVQAELLISRMLKFDLNVVHPHKYMLHYMKSLQDWFGASKWNSMPIAKTAAAFLQDFHHSPDILDYKPSHIALCCLSLAFECYGIKVPLTEEQDPAGVWYSAFTKDLSKEKHWEIVEKIMEVYNADADLDNKNK